MTIYDLIGSLFFAATFAFSVIFVIASILSLFSRYTTYYDE